MNYLSLLLFLTIHQIFAQSSTYTYLTNGADWGKTCATGIQQSPIDIDTDLVTKCDPYMLLDINWKDQAIEMETEDLGTTLKSFGNYSTVYASDLNGDIYGYDGYQFHFHTPSEHKINGIIFPMELHLVLKLRPEFGNGNGRNLAVLGVLFEIEDSTTGCPLLEEYQTADKASHSYNMKTLLGDYLQKPIRYFHYKGGLTTPDCDEVVNWYVFETPLKMTTAQYKKFASHWILNYDFAHGKGNNREVKPLNGREVRMGGVESSECREDFVSFFGFFILFLFLIYVMFKVVP